MCLHIDKRRMNIHAKATQRHAMVAVRPLVVKKRLVTASKAAGETPYQRTLMTFGNRYDITDRKTFDIYNGVYNHIASIEGGGFHALMFDATSKNCTWLPYSCYEQELYPAIIPAGTKFFIGTDRDIVARSIIVYHNMRDLEAAHGKMDATLLPVEIYSKRAPR